jgi:hypothetical protein
MNDANVASPIHKWPRLGRRRHSKNSTGWSFPCISVVRIKLCKYESVMVDEEVNKAVAVM